MNEKMEPEGVKIKIVPIPRAEETKVLPTMMAAGTAPDLCYTYDKNLVSMYVSQGGLLDYSPYMKEYGPNLKKIYSERDLEAGQFSGKQYTFRSIMESIGRTTWIRKDWLDALGLDVPRNIEELYNVLKAFKAKDPGNVGDKMMPLALPQMHLFWDNIVLTAFVEEPPSDEKLVTPAPLWPETKEALRFLNKLFNEGLLGDLLLDKNDELLNQGMVRGEIGTFLYFGHYPFHTAYGNLYVKLKENVPNAKLVSILPWTQGDREPYVNFLRGSKYGRYFFSPKTAKDPVAVVKFPNWLASDEAITVSQAGIEGEHYTLDSDGIITPINDDVFTNKVAWIEPQYQALVKLYANDMQNYVKFMARNFDASVRQEFIDNVQALIDPPFQPIEINLPQPAADKYLKSLTTKWDEEVVPLLITAPVSDFDRLFDEALAEYKKNGGDEVAKEAVENYRTQYGKK